VTSRSLGFVASRLFLFFVSLIFSVSRVLDLSVLPPSRLLGLWDFRRPGFSAVNSRFFIKLSSLRFIKFCTVRFKPS
jgi:hypothetical protein